MFLSVCRNLKATLIPVQLHYGEYPTSWLPGIFGFDLKRGKKQTACEWKSTDAKVQYATTFPLGDYLWRVLLTLLTQTPNYLLAGCYFIGDNRNASCIFFLHLFFIHSFNPNRNQCLTPLKITKTKSSIYVMLYNISLQKWAIWHDVSKSSWLHFQVINVTVKFKFKIKWLFISSANELLRAR